MASESAATGLRRWLAHCGRALYARPFDCITALHVWAMIAVMPTDGRFRTLFPPEPDTVGRAAHVPSAAAISAHSEAIFQAAAEQGVHTVPFRHSAALLGGAWPDGDCDRPEVTWLRSCRTKPEHYDWPARMWAVVERATDACCE